MLKPASVFSLHRNTVFLCGGLGLIGKATAEILGKAGAKVVILDLDNMKGKKTAEEFRDRGLDVFFEKMDIRRMDKFETTFKAIVRKYKTIDVWINLSYPRTKDWGKSIEKLRLNDIKINVDWQLNSCLWSSRAVALLMKEKKIKGNIINCGSIYGIQSSDFNIYQGTDLTSPYAYSAIKAGVANLTRYIAAYFGPHQIRANCICPGGIFDHQADKFVKNYNRKVPLKRMADPKDIATAILFLASDAASYMTGTALVVDGGWTIV